MSGRVLGQHQNSREVLNANWTWCVCEFSGQVHFIELPEWNEGQEHRMCTVAIEPGIHRRQLPEDQLDPCLVMHLQTRLLAQLVRDQWGRDVTLQLHCGDQKPRVRSIQFRAAQSTFGRHANRQTVFFEQPTEWHQHRGIRFCSSISQQSGDVGEPLVRIIKACRSGRCKHVSTPLCLI